MAITTTTRVGLNNYGAGTDPFTRAQVNADHAAIEAKAVIFLTPDTLANRPVAAAANAHAIFLATDSGDFYYSTGATWYALGGAGGGGFAHSFLTMGG